MSRNDSNPSWKRNFRKIPQRIHTTLSSISSDLVIVAASKKVPVVEIKRGVYRHLGLQHNGTTVVASGPTIPPAKMGKFSDRNVNDWEVVREDLPKITKTFFWETPNFGDAATYGTHMHSQDREVYQREWFEARHLAIAVEILSQQEESESVLVKFAVEAILDRTREDFEQELLLFLNILQENAGVSGIYPSTASRQDFMGSITLDWEIFPPGTADEVIIALTKGQGIRGSRAGIVQDRVKLFATLKPKAYLRGTGSFNSYVGAQYANDLVVFENVTYGHALYVLYEGWEEISKRSRLDLLKGTTQNFDRFPHTDGWAERFTEHMQAELDKRKRPPKRNQG